MLSIQGGINSYPIKSNQQNKINFKGVTPKISPQVKQNMKTGVKVFSLASLCASAVAMLCKVFSLTNDSTRKVNSDSSVTERDKMMDFIMSDCDEDLSTLDCSDFGNFI